VKKSAILTLVLGIGLTVPIDSFADERRAARFIAATRELLGVAYQLGGRLRAPGDGIDCQGLIFYAAERIGRCGWRSFSVMPTETSAWRELGAPVPGLAPISTQALEMDRLKPGDVLWLLFAMVNPAEPPIASLAERSVWVWHSAVYTGAGRFIHADPFAGAVVEQDLKAFLLEYGYDGLWVTRMARGPRPRRCRIHPPMPRPPQRSQSTRPVQIRSPGPIPAPLASPPGPSAPAQPGPARRPSGPGR
jgi:cell wall-associated NlpC family hydrolase